MTSEISTLQILKNLPSETSRILKLSRKPSWEEFNEVAKITGLGIVILGFIGFAITFIAWLVGHMLR